MRNEHHIQPIKCAYGRFNHFLVAIKIIHIEHECLYAPGPAHLQIIADILKFLGGAGDQKKLYTILSKTLSRFMGNRRGCPYNQYSHLNYTVYTFTNFSEKLTRRQKLEEKCGSTYRANSLHLGKNAWKFSALMRA